MLTGINDAGQIVGYTSDWSGLEVHGFLKTDAGYRSFDYPGARTTQAYGINDAGQIVGSYFDSWMIMAL